MTDIPPYEAPKYISRFLDGETTLAEERALYRLYLSGTPLGAEAEELREMMTMLAAAAGVDSPARETRLLHLLRWTSIAALFAIVFTASLILPANESRASALPADYARYEGSYIVRNGDTIRDLRIVVPELRRVEAEMQRVAQEVERPADIDFISL